MDGGRHLRPNNLRGTPDFLFTHKEKLCLSGVTASELTRYLQSLEKNTKHMCLAIVFHILFLSFWFSLSVSCIFVLIYRYSTCQVQHPFGYSYAYL